jgi:hypothetical protein
MTPADTLFPTAPPTVCGAPSPAEIGAHTCERPPDHGGPHWVRGPRSTSDPMWRTWTVDWRDES